MTAMNVNDIPEAILRSGRVEVWLETKVPDQETRRDILIYYGNEVASAHTTFDADHVAQHSGGFTPADLRRIIGDAKALLGYDLYQERKPKPFTEYLIEAVTSLRDLRSKIARATQLSGV